MRSVLFASTRPLERAETIRTVYEAYNGKKNFVQVNGCRRHEAIRSGAYDLLVIDEFPTETPGKCLMIWHSIHGGKTIGMDQPYAYYNAKYQRQLITKIVTSGHGAVASVAKCAELSEENVLPLGMPRTDMYVGKHKGDGQTALARKKHSWLYAPTFRTREEPPKPEVDWEWLDRQLSDDELIAVKPHPVDSGILPRPYPHIIEIPGNEPSAPYLYDCDAVITDYSTIIFDGWLLGKPAVLLEKEKGYVSARGMYLKYPEEYCDRYATDEKEMLRMLREATEPGETERECLRKMADMCDGHATERICRLIREMKGDD